MGGTFVTKIILKFYFRLVCKIQSQKFPLENCTPGILIPQINLHQNLKRNWNVRGIIFGGDFCGVKNPRNSRGEKKPRKTFSSKKKLSHRNYDVLGIHLESKIVQIRFQILPWNGILQKLFFVCEKWKPKKRSQKQFLHPSC